MEEKTGKIISRRTFILFIIFAVLLLYLIIYSAVAEHKNKKSQHLFSFLIGDVQRIQLYNDKNNVVLERNGSVWYSPAVRTVKMSKRAVDDFLDNLRNIKVIKKITDIGSLDEYGFHSSGILPSITLNLEKNKNIKIILGDEVISKKAFYVMYNHAVYIVPDSAAALFRKDLFQFRDKHIFDFLSSDVNYLKIHLGGRAVLLRQITLTNHSRQWVLRYPSVKNLPAEKVNTVLFELEDLETQQIIDGKQLNLEYFGVPSNNFIILKTDKNQVYKGYIGKKAEKGYYFFLENRPNIMYIVSDYFVDHTLKDYIANLKESSDENKQR